jgi:flagellar biosynthesis/type III secretory pathway M-ring protein FliF/YscJ
MNASLFSQGIGWLACLGIIGLIVILAIVARAISRQRRRPMEPNNSAVQPLSASPFEDGELSEIPTTGSVQAYERDYHPEQIIGSSGFDVQSYDDELGEEQEE